MTKTGQNFEVYQGATLQVTFNVDNAGTTDAKSLTGGTVAWAAFRNQDDAAALAVLGDTDTSITTVNIDDTDDGIRFTIDSGHSDGLDAREYYYEVWAKDSSGNVTPVATGAMRVIGASVNL